MSLASGSLEPFLQNISSFPTVFFTFFLGFALLYWLTAMLGLVDIDVFDVDLPGAETGDASGSLEALAGILHKFNLTGVPVTVILTLMALVGWVVSYLMVDILFRIIPDGILQYLVGACILFATLYVALIVTSICIKPFRPLLQKLNADGSKQIIGQPAVVRTSVVNSAFGEATMEEDGAVLILKVRSADGEEFVKGDRVVPYEHLKEEDVYLVVSESKF